MEKSKKKSSNKTEEKPANNKPKHTRKKNIKDISDKVIKKTKKNKNKTNNNKNKKMDNLTDSSELFDTEIEDAEPLSHVKEKTKKELRAEKKQLKRKRQKLIKVGIIAGCSLAGIYIFGCILFSIVCFPRTSIADVDISLRPPSLMESEIKNNASNYELNIYGLDFNKNIKGSEIDYTFDSTTVIKNVSENKNPFLWPYEIFQIHDFQSTSIINFNKDKATNILSTSVQEHNVNAVVPVNANIVYDTSKFEVTIKPEVLGNSIDTDKFLTLALGHIGSGKKSLTLTSNEQILPTLFSRDERINLAVEQGNQLVKSVLSLKMGSAIVDTLNSSHWSQWLELKDNYTAGLNDDLVGQWAASLGASCDTVGKAKTFTTPYGKAVTVSGGDSIGWEIDKEALADLVKEQAPSGLTKTLDVPCTQSTNDYQGPGKKDWGARYIDVDLSQQHARFYNDAGALIWEANIVSGKPESPTPCGIYTLKQVGGPTILLGQFDPATGKREYETVVQNWLPFVGNSIGFHDAYWQSSFGGDAWQTGRGSHGCVNLSSGDASSLRAVAQVGDIVVVHA